ncbi:MAG TPA: DUF2961 domain-containing protein [Fimbriimonadaceae bacterium]|nr:DUF2961 domain-containing protein [Fimbriimonadaceae bacterium]
MRAFCVLIGLTLVAGGFAQVTSNSILDETANLTRLTKRPNPYYTTAEATSYDRASKTPGNADWFANADAGQFIRVEENDGRKERVMADLTGPGAVVRIWSANPAGTLRFYFDGEQTPRFVEKTKDLLGGSVQPFVAPFAYEAARGWNFYYPLPYAKSLKITVDDSDNDGAAHLYYHVGYRTYAPGTQVETFDPANVDAAEIDKVGKLLTNPYSPGYVPDYKMIALKGEGTATVKLPPGPKAVTYFYVRLYPQKLPKNAQFDDANQVYNQLRQIVLEADFDGETCVRVPLGDFFGTAPGLNKFQTFPLQVDSEGGMACRFVMPYAKTGVIRFHNTAKARADLRVYAETFNYTWDSNSYHFKAQWGGEHARTRPMRDMTFLKTSGEGVFVGDNLHVTNPSPAWWGEGDEKIYFDDQTFPSSFGTGSEDYFGYAWGANITFAKPFHAQPHTTSPDSFGNAFVERFHIMDSIHFQKNFKFDMEMWHWADCVATYVHTIYYYERPGGTPPAEIDPRLLTIFEVKPPEPVKGAIEGENLKIASKTGSGTTENQTGFWDTSNNGQLWWRDGAPGDALDLLVPVKKAGKYKVVGHFCFARDYGIQEISINGQPAKQVDFYSPDLTWKMVDLGTFELPAGETHFVVKIAGANPKSDPKAYMFGLDYLKLEKP